MTTQTWPTDEAREAVPDCTRLRIHGTWLASEVDEHTCGTGPDGYYGHHEPGCGLIPEVDLSTLPGWSVLVRAERAAALREAADWLDSFEGPGGRTSAHDRAGRDIIRLLRGRAEAEERADG